MVVDDDRVQLELLRTLLEDAGFMVHLARNAGEAVAMVERVRPAAILSDVVMDETDGFTLCRTFRRTPSLAAIPVVLMSAAFSEEEDRRLAREVGANELVGRTPDMALVIDALVRSLADGPRLRAAASVSELYARRVSHRLATLQEQSSVAEARCAAIFESSTDAISVLTPDGYVLDVNKRWEEILGLPREQVIGRHIRQLAAFGYADGNTEAYRDGVKGGGCNARPTALTRADGSTAYLELTHVSVDRGGETSIMSIGHDVTARVEAEHRLERSERKYRALVENLPAVVWSARLDGSMRFVSPNIVPLCGFTAEEVLEGSCGIPFTRVHAEDVRTLESAFQALQSGEAPVLDLEYRWRHKDGRWVWVHGRAAAAVDGDGERCIDGVFTDVTGRKLLEEQLRQSQRIEAVGQLTAGVAHDFNNLVTVILANGEFLVESLEEGDERREDARDIVAASLRAAALTKQLLAFSRRQPVELGDLDLGEVVSGLERMLARALGGDVELLVSAQPNLDLVRVDAGQIEQVLMNLAVNARDAMAHKGTLTIETSNVELDGLAEIRGAHPPRGAYVMMKVIDTGRGMDAATEEKIFEPFFTTKPKGEGTGLGLSTSYGIVRQFGGHIAVTSEPGHGTAFTLYFPRAAPAAGRAVAVL